MEFLAVGEAMVDVVAPAREPRRSHAPIEIRAGGTAINAALAAAALGFDAAAVARVGDDPPAALLRAALDAAGIVPRFAVDRERPTGCFVQVGDRIVADRGANVALSEDDVGALEAEVVLVSGYTLLAAETAAAGAAALRARALWTAADAGSAALAASAQAQRRLEPALVLFANAAEAAALTGLEPEAAARQLAAVHEVVVVKLGADGALGIRGGNLARAKAGRAAGWIGDGDAFDAGVLVGLARGLDIGDSLELGAQAAASLGR